jgi:hypothetical protein
MSGSSIDLDEDDYIYEPVRQVQQSLIHSQC